MGIVMGVKNKIVKISVVRKYPKSWRADIRLPAA